MVRDDDSLIEHYRREVQKRSAALYYKVLHVVGDEEDAREVHQDVMFQIDCEIRRQVGRRREIEYLGGFCFKIARNMAINARRKLNHRRHERLDNVGDRGAVPCPAEHRKQGSQRRDAEIAQKYERLRRALSVQDLRLLRLHFAEGMTQEEIVECFDREFSQPTASRRLRRALRRARALGISSIDPPSHEGSPGLQRVFLSDS